MTSSCRTAYVSLLICLLALSAVSAEREDGFQARPLSVPQEGRSFLQQLSPASTGITFTNVLTDEKDLENSMRSSGSGVAAGDVDGDGWCDLYFTGMESTNVLYRNRGNWKFEDITAKAGVGCEGQYSSGTALADVDGDGDLDLLVNSLGGGTRLFFNDGKARFTESTNSGLMRKYGATSMALGDLDGNGTLDLYVCNYATTKIEDRPNAKFEYKTVGKQIILTAIDGVPTTSPELTNRYFVDNLRIVRERGEPDFLYMNDGKGKFTVASWTNGTFLDEAGKRLEWPTYDTALSVMFRDLDGDSIPDIYVCNDLFPPERLWINNGKGQFRAMSNLAVRNTSRLSMGIDFADINRDGYEDFLVVDMLARNHVHRIVQTGGSIPLFLQPGLINNRPQYKRNTLFLNRGDGTYAEIGQYSGLHASEWSWMPLFLDVDMDGYEDVLITTGHMRDSLHGDAIASIQKARAAKRLSDAEHRAVKRHFYPVLNLTNQLFRNKGDLTFEDKAAEWGFTQGGISHGMCLADLDNDGDQDVVINYLNGAGGIYRNETAAPRVAVRLKGKAPNRHGIGAKIRVVGAKVPMMQEIIAGGRYLSSDEPRRSFPTLGATNLTIEVTWRSGLASIINNARPNYLYEISEDSAAPLKKEKAPPLFPDMRFEDVSQKINHKHVDDGFNDFERQPTLIKRLSQEGPGVAWHDLNGDDWDDLFIGAGVNGQLAVFRNDGKGRLVKADPGVLRESAPRDYTALIGMRSGGGKNRLLAGFSNYEDGQPVGSIVREFDLTQPQPLDRFPAWEISAGPLAMADVNGDGNLDVFVGGRVVSGRYPETCSSLLFNGKNDGFEIDEENCRRLAIVGLATGAAFTDLNTDGQADLVVATEWGPLKMFRNEGGKLVGWNPPIKFSTSTNCGVEKSTIALASGGSSSVTLSNLTGWWNGVAAGDFDSDGKMDFIASNWGRNTKFEEHRKQPLRIYYGEWRSTNSVDVLDAYYDSASKKWVAWSTYAVAKALPWVPEKFPTQQSFAQASVQEILGERMKSAKVLEAVWLETTLFLNRGSYFEARALPVEAQLAPTFGIAVADFDGNGTEDAFLSQNFFAGDGDTARYDAGRGLLLSGDGQGNLTPVPGHESRIQVYGEQRGCAASDFNGDGRVDLAVTQNAAETKLYRNSAAKPGVRVRLKGPPGNITGVGASIRVISINGAGPAREVTAGSGYWSQNSAVQVMSAGQPGQKLEVRWPGGKLQTVDIPQNAREITVQNSGSLP